MNVGWMDGSEGRSWAPLRSPISAPVQKLHRRIAGTRKAPYRSGAFDFPLIAMERTLTQPCLSTL